MAAPPQIWLGRWLEKGGDLDLQRHCRAALLWLNHASRGGGFRSPGVKVQLQCYGLYKLVPKRSASLPLGVHHSRLLLQDMAQAQQRNYTIPSGVNPLPAFMQARPSQSGAAPLSIPQGGSTTRLAWVFELERSALTALLLTERGDSRVLARELHRKIETLHDFQCEHLETAQDLEQRLSQARLECKQYMLQCGELQDAQGKLTLQLGDQCKDLEQRLSQACQDRQQYKLQYEELQDAHGKLTLQFEGQCKVTSQESCFALTSLLGQKGLSFNTRPVDTERIVDGFNASTITVCGYGCMPDTRFYPCACHTNHDATRVLAKNRAQ
ncbi:hypothetical protein ABBQ38_003433 [Trebouxia sp. C0009 RCD-2024]